MSPGSLILRLLMHLPRSGHSRDFPPTRECPLPVMPLIWNFSIADFYSFRPTGKSLIDEVNDDRILSSMSVSHCIAMTEQDRKKPSII